MQTAWFESIFKRYVRRVRQYFRTRVAETETVDDLVQEVFLRVFRHRLTYDPRIAESAWIFTIARNVLIDHFRRCARTSAESLQDPSEMEQLPDPARRIDGREVLAAIEQLGEAQRRVLIETKVHKRTMEDVARELGISIRSAHRRLSEALIQLRQILRQGGVL